MKILLDDERIPVEEGWTVVRTAHDFTTLVRRRYDDITTISFDHDLGSESESGAWCLAWLIRKIHAHPQWFETLTEIIIHSGNREAAKNMIFDLRSAARHISGMANVKITWWDCTVVVGHVMMPPDFDYSQRDVA